MEYCKLAPSPFHYGVKLSTTYTFPEVDSTLYRQLVGSILYLTHSRPDLSFAVVRVSRYMQTPHESHWKAEKKNILIYSRYNSIWDSLQYRWETFVGWFH